MTCSFSVSNLLFLTCLRLERFGRLDIDWASVRSVGDGINDKRYPRFMARYDTLFPFISHYRTPMSFDGPRDSGRTERRSSNSSLTVQCAICTYVGSCAKGCWGESTSNNSIPTFFFFFFVEWGGILCGSLYRRRPIESANQGGVAPPSIGQPRYQFSRYRHREKAPVSFIASSARVTT